MPDIPKDLFKTIQRIQIQTGHLVENILAGAYKSAFKGQGIEFEEDREYQEGDDIRHIDWNVTQRMNHPYVKVFREERDLTVMLIVDVSSSSRFGSIDRTKSEIIAEIGAVIAFSAIKNLDRIGLLLFTDRVELYIPPRKGTRHVLRIIRELLAFEPEGQGTNINAALEFVGNILTRPGVCFLISDFISPDYSHAVTLTAQKHDLVTIGISDPHEMDFPGLGLIEMRDLESGEVRLIDTSDERVRKKLQQSSQERMLKHKQLMDKLGAGFIPIRTDQSIIPPIRKFFKLRGTKRR